jgi:leucine dehydrogenase
MHPFAQGIMERHFEQIEQYGPSHVDIIVHPPSGLRAVLVLDSLALGPAAGGIRTAPYQSLDEALFDALSLARAMTYKCALAKIAAGGGKMVVLEQPNLNRELAFQFLGQRVQELKGIFRTAGDLGTSATDLRQMQQYCDFVHLDHGSLSRAAGKTLIATIEACIDLGHLPPFNQMSAAVQGCGDMGTSAIQALSQRGVALTICDLDAARARNLATQVGSKVCPPAEFFSEKVDLLVPCAGSHVIDEIVGKTITAKAVVGTANNILKTPKAEDTLQSREIVFVPDFLSSSGAVIAGVAETIMGVESEPLLHDIKSTTRLVLQQSMGTSPRRRATDIAIQMAQERIGQNTGLKIHPEDSNRV